MLGGFATRRFVVNVAAKKYPKLLILLPFHSEGIHGSELVTEESTQIRMDNVNLGLTVLSLFHIIFYEI